MAQSRPNGQFTETQYFDNVGGLNTSDSPFKVADTQSTGGANFEYSQTGGIQKRRGSQKVNTVADTQLRSHGIEVYTATTNVQTPIRAADTKIQAVDLGAFTFTNLSQDTTAAGTDVFPVGTLNPTSFAPFNTDTVAMLNFDGNTSAVYSIYSPTKFTKNGSAPPAGALSIGTIGGGGAFQTTGTFTYAVSFIKASTGAESNATLDRAVTIMATTNSVVLTFSAVTSVDTVTYNQMNIYRSPVAVVAGDASGFTTGDLVATIPWPAVSYTDTGQAALTSENVPRANNLILDNSVLPTGTYNTLCLWKRRLVTATGNVLRFSDLNKPESWPTVNTITVASGGDITGVAIISFNTDFGNDEYLAVFQKRQLWLVKGNDYTDVTLSFIDTVGCANQALIQLANGFLSWVDYRGIYLWDGSGKPIYTSQPIEPFFAIDGDLDKSKLPYGTSSYFRNRNMVYWFLSSKIAGDQKLAIKMDLRLTLPNIGATSAGRVLPGVFVDDTTTIPVYGAKAYLPDVSSDEIMLTGDASGFIYKAYQQFSDAGAGIDFQYLTPFLDMDSPNISKRFHKIILWVDALGTWDITMDYWAGYRASLPNKSTLLGPITTQVTNATSLWDVAFWDQAYWDDYTQSLAPVVFNLNNSQGNQEGDCIRMNFRNNGVDQPVTIYGYTVVWTEIAMRH